MRKCIVPAAKRVGVDLLEIVVPEIAEVVGSGKKFKTAAKSVKRQTLRKQLGSRKRLRAESFQQNLKNETVSCEETFSQTILINHVE